MTDIAVKPNHPALVAEMEAEAERAFLTWFTASQELPGPRWSHVVEPLLTAWQQKENALCLVRCL